MTVAQSVLTILAVVAAPMLTRFLPFLIFPEGKTPPPPSTTWALSCPTRRSGCWRSTA